MEFNIPDDRSYTKEHLWIKIYSPTKKAVAGITDAGIKGLGGITNVGFLRKNGMIEANDPIAFIESVKAIVEISLPFSYEIININENLEKNPHIISKHPYSEGYLIEIFLPENLTSILLNKEQYINFIHNI